MSATLDAPDPNENVYRIRHDVGLGYAMAKLEGTNAFAPNMHAMGFAEWFENADDRNLSLAESWVKYIEECKALGVEP